MNFQSYFPRYLYTKVKSAHSDFILIIPDENDLAFLKQNSIPCENIEGAKYLLNVAAFREKICV